MFLIFRGLVGAFFPQGRDRRTGQVLIRRDNGFVLGEGASATGSSYDDG